MRGVGDSLDMRQLLVDDINGIVACRAGVDVEGKNGAVEDVILRLPPCHVLLATAGISLEVSADDAANVLSLCLAVARHGEIVCHGFSGALHRGESADDVGPRHGGVRPFLRCSALTDANGKQQLIDVLN